MNAFVQDKISGIRLVKAFTREATEQESFAQKNREYCQSNLMVVKAWSLFTPSMTFTASLGTLMILIFGSRQVLAHQLSLGEWIAFVSYLALFYQPINQIHSLNHMMQHAMAAGRRIFEILDYRAEGDVDALPHTNPLTLTLSPKGGEGRKERENDVLSFQNVS